MKPVGHHHLSQIKARCSQSRSLAGKSLGNQSEGEHIYIVYNEITTKIRRLERLKNITKIQRGDNLMVIPTIAEKWCKDYLLRISKVKYNSSLGIRLVAYLRY